MVNKLIVLVLVSFLTLTLGLPVVGASDLSTTNTIEDLRRESLKDTKERLEELRQKRQEKLDEVRERHEQIIEKRRQKVDEIKERVATRQAEPKSHVIVRIKSIFAKILERYLAALNRLDDIAERIATRADKLKERGVDTKAVDEALANAESFGAQAASSIEDAKAQVASIDEQSTEVHDAVSQSKEAIRIAKNALKAYHKALVAAIIELKAAANLREGTESAD